MTHPVSHLFISNSSAYLTPPGLHIKHVGCVMLQSDDLAEVHVLVEELRTKLDERFHQYTTAD